MANISLDFSAAKIFNNGDNSFRDYIYRDIGTNNIKNYKDPDGVIKIYDIDTSLYDDGAIKNSLINLFMFRPGQQILKPEFGNQLYKYLYQPMLQFTADKIVRTLRDMIQKWQPRITILDMPIQTDSENNTYYIQINYYIPTLKQKSSINIAINKNGTSI